MPRFVRLNSLYNYEPRKDDERRKGNKPAKKRKTRVGLLAVGKTKLHEDYLLRDSNNPLIPGTDVQRLSVVYLGPKTPATTDDEVNRVIADLQRWAAKCDHRPRANADTTKTTVAEATTPARGRATAQQGPEFVLARGRAVKPRRCGGRT